MVLDLLVRAIPVQRAIQLDPTHWVASNLYSKYISSSKALFVLSNVIHSLKPFPSSDIIPLHAYLMRKAVLLNNVPLDCVLFL